MSKQIKYKESDKVKVRLDSKTVMILRSIKLFAKWKKSYPEAVVLT